MKAEIIPITDMIRRFPSDPVISLSGAGGKTTLLFRIAHGTGGAAVVTTTTKVGADQILSADRQMTCGEFSEPAIPGVIWISPSLEPYNGKIIGCSLQDFGSLAAECRKYHIPLINEADGAACRHIKAPAYHEPVIPPETNVCFYLAGLDVLGKPVTEEYVHRPQLFCTLTGARMDHPIRAEHILKLFDHPDGGLKNMPSAALKAAYLTHADTDERIAAGIYIAEKIENYQFICLS